MVKKFFTKDFNVPDETNTNPDTSQPNTPSTTPFNPSPTTSTDPVQPVGVESEPDTANVPQSDSAPMQPFIGSTPVAAPPAGLQPKKKKLLIGIIIAVVLVVVGTAGALAYNFWYQNPEKVLSDALGNALRAKSVTYTGSIVAENKADNSTIKIDVGGGNDNTGKGTVDATIAFTADGKTYTIKGAALTDAKGDLYIQAKDIRPLYDSYVDEIGVALPESLDAFVDKINNKWIRISSSDLKDLGYTTNDDVNKCISEASKKLMGDEATAKELSELYKKNKFVVVDKKLGGRGDSLGYTLKGDEAAAKSFVKGLEETAIYKEFKKCDESFSLNADDLFKEAEDSDSTGTFEVWVSRWGHEFTELKVDGKATDATFVGSMKPQFNKPVTVETPTDFLTIKQLQDELTSIFEELYTYDDTIYEDDLTTSDFYTTN